MKKMLTGIALGTQLVLTAGEAGTALAPGGVSVRTDRQEISIAVPGGGKLQLIDRLGRSREIVSAGETTLPPLPCGYYELFQDGKKLSGIAVVPAEYPNDRNSRLGVDYAMSTAPDLPAGRKQRDELFRQSARLARLAGVRNVRERINLKQGLRRQANGTFSFHEPNTVAALKASHEAGLFVCAFFQNMPNFLGRGGNSLRTPQNLQESYAAVTAVARSIGRFIDAWEIYNEMDLRNFYEGTAWEYASFAKTAMLAIRRADPGAQLLLGSFATPAPGFRSILAASEIAPYYDIDNLHSYSRGAALQAYLANLRRSLTHPAHATETGIHLPAWRPGASRDYPAAASKMTADQLGTVYAEALASGCEKVYFFLWRFYPACGSILDRDFQPTERLAALATVNAKLGNGIYLGSRETEGVRLHLFDTGFGRKTLVISATDSPRKIRIGLRGAYSLVAATGEIISSGRADGELKVEAGNSTLYLSAETFSDSFRNTAPVSSERKTTEAPAAVLEVAFHPEPAYDAGTPAYEVQPGAVLEGEVRIFNFGKSTLSGRPSGTVSDGWKLEFNAPQLTIAPGSTANAAFRLTAPVWRDRGRCPADLRFSLPGASASMVRLALAYSSLIPSKTTPAFSVPLQELRWQPGGSPAGLLKQQIRPSANGTRFKIDFLAPGVRMFWPSLRELPEGKKQLDWSGYDGLRLRLRVHSTRPGTWLMATLTEPQGTRYNSSRILVEKPGEIELLYIFSYFVYTDSVPDDPLFSLDLDRISNFALGFHTLSKYRENFQENYTVEYEITGIDLVKY